MHTSLDVLRLAATCARLFSNSLNYTLIQLQRMQWKGGVVLLGVLLISLQQLGTLFPMLDGPVLCIS